MLKKEERGVGSMAVGSDMTDSQEAQWGGVQSEPPNADCPSAMFPTIFDSMLDTTALSQNHGRLFNHLQQLHHQHSTPAQATLTHWLYRRCADRIGLRLCP